VLFVSSYGAAQPKSGTFNKLSFTVQLYEIKRVKVYLLNAHHQPASLRPDEEPRKPYLELAGGKSRCAPETRFHRAGQDVLETSTPVKCG
jgi:hypothetical protein